MTTLPANLPKAKLPATYEGARTALEKCSRIDECAEWANKAEALASYAKQAEDETLRKMADRIQARAVQRCGELLEAIKKASGAHRKSGGAPTFSRARAAADAGLSKGQAVTAIRVARVPRDDFEAAVESDDPPTVTELAERGRRPRPKPTPKRTHYDQALDEARAWMKKWRHLAALTPVFDAITTLIEGGDR